LDVFARVIFEPKLIRLNVPGATRLAIEVCHAARASPI